MTSWSRYGKVYSYGIDHDKQPFAIVGFQSDDGYSASFPLRLTNITDAKIGQRVTFDITLEAE